MFKEYDIILRGHHLVMLYHYCFLGGESYVRENMLSEGYGEEHTEHVVEIFRRIKKSDKLKIIIVDMPDDICEKCRRKKVKCYSALDDLSVITYVGLRVCKVYTSKYILKKLERVVY